MPDEGRSAALQVETLHALFRGLNNKLLEVSNHLQVCEQHWRLLVRLRLVLKWLWRCGAPAPEALDDVLALLDTALNEADERLVAQGRSCGDLIVRVDRLVREAGEAVSRSGTPGRGDKPCWVDPVHEALVRMVLCREGIASADPPLPEPVETFTGVAGVSQGYLLALNHHNRAHAVFAKFDEPDRRRLEWLAIERLLLLPLPRACILPLPSNELGDGVIVSDAARTSRTKGCETLASFLRNQLRSGLANCHEALRRAVDPLAHFYALRVRSDEEKWGRSRGHWIEVFPDIKDQLDRFADAVQRPPPSADEEAGRRWFEAAAHFWKEHNWRTEQLALVPGEADCYNPLVEVARMRDQPVEPYFRRSRIHGDLNLTNILVCPTEDGTPDAVFIIDFAKFDDSQLTAVDLARLEVALWQEVYAPLVQKVPSPPLGFCRALAYLDGRAESLDQLDEVTRRCAALVLYIRRLAYSLLRPEPNGPHTYIFQDYFHCLYFSHLYFLGWKTVYESPGKVCLGLAGAAAALGMIRDRRRFSAGADAPFRRPWETPAPEGSGAVSSG